MKSKIATLALASMLTLGTVGCAMPTTSSSSATSEAASETTSEASNEPSNAAEIAQRVMENWTGAESSEQAAEGAGLEMFDVPEQIVLDSTTYADPIFGYSGGTAQAIYAGGDTALLVRKATEDSTVTTADIDRTVDSFDWTRDIDDVTVICYGPAKGAAHAVTWEENGLKYGIVRQGSSAQKPTMDNDDVMAAVKAVREANGAIVVAETPEPAKKREATTADESVTVPEDQAKKTALDAAGLGNGANAKISLVQGKDGKLYDVEVSNGALTYLVCIDAATNEVYSVDLISGFDVNKLIGEEGAINAVMATLDLNEEDLAGTAAELIVGGGATCYDVTINLTDGSTLTRQVLAFDGQVLEGGADDYANEEGTDPQITEEQAYQKALESVGWTDCAYYTIEIISDDTPTPYYNVNLTDLDGTTHNVGISAIDGTQMFVD